MAVTKSNDDEDDDDEDEDDQLKRTSQELYHIEKKKIHQKKQNIVTDGCFNCGIIIIMKINSGFTLTEQ